MSPTPPIAGISLPGSKLCTAATDHARRLSEPFLFNHLMRTYLFAGLAGEAGGEIYDPELLYLGCVLHDLGLCDAVPVAARFEVDGADAARSFLAEQGLEEPGLAVVWDAIALHTTFAVPQRKRPEIALVQLGAAIDVGVAPAGLLPAAAVAEVVDRWPRLDFKRRIVAVLAQQVARDPRSASSPVVADAAERHVHGFRRANICDAIDAAPFAA